MLCELFRCVAISFSPGWVGINSSHFFRNYSQVGPHNKFSRSGPLFEAVQFGADLYRIPFRQVEGVLGNFCGYLRQAIVHYNAFHEFCAVALGQVDYVKMYWNFTLNSTDDNCVGKLVA